MPLPWKVDRARSIHVLTAACSAQGSLAHRYTVLTTGQYQASRFSSSQADKPLDTDTILQKLVNHEQQGVPDRAGANGVDGFDLASSMLCYTVL